MAAEKLTKKRLIQILIMLIVLLTAFFIARFIMKPVEQVNHRQKHLKKTPHFLRIKIKFWNEKKKG